MDAQLGLVLDPAYVAGLSDMTIEELRSRRSVCQSLEGVLSFRRRMAQGRLDIVGAERRRRQDGKSSLDSAGSVAELPGVLSEGFTDRSRPRLAAAVDLDENIMDTDELDAIVGPSVLSSLGNLSDQELEQRINDLSSYEKRVSGERRRIHECIDAFQGEITRRYQSGEASVDSLLH